MIFSCCFPSNELMLCSWVPQPGLDRVLQATEEVAAPGEEVQPGRATDRWRVAACGRSHREGRGPPTEQVGESNPLWWHRAGLRSWPRSRKLILKRKKSRRSQQRNLAACNNKWILHLNSYNEAEVTWLGIGLGSIGVGIKVGVGLEKLMLGLRRVWVVENQRLAFGLGLSAVLQNGINKVLSKLIWFKTINNGIYF